VGTLYSFPVLLRAAGSVGLTGCLRTKTV